jgi:hypothetical protein
MPKDPQSKSVANPGDVDNHQTHPDSDSELSSDQETNFPPSISSVMAAPTPISIKLKMKRPSFPITPITAPAQSPKLPTSGPVPNASAIASSSISDVPGILSTNTAPNSSNATGSSDKRPRSEDDQPSPELTEQGRPSKTARNDLFAQTDGILAGIQDLSDPEFGRHLLGMITRHVTISGDLQVATTSNHDLKTRVEQQNAAILVLKREIRAAFARIGEVEKERDLALDAVKSAKAESEANMVAMKSELDGLKTNHQEMEKERDEAAESAKLAKESQDKVVKRKEELGQEVFLLIKELEFTKAKLAGSQVSHMSFEVYDCKLTFRTMRGKWRT